jgi:hypothetical protein
MGELSLLSSISKRLSLIDHAELTLINDEKHGSQQGKRDEHAADDEANAVHGAALR